MKITEVRFHPCVNVRLLAFASITIDGWFVVKDLKILRGPDGLYLGFPTKKLKNGNHQNIAYPCSPHFRHKLEQFVLEKYEHYISKSSGAESQPTKLSA